MLIRTAVVAMALLNIVTIPLAADADQPATAAKLIALLRACLQIPFGRRARLGRHLGVELHRRIELGFACFALLDLPAETRSWAGKRI